MPYLLLILEEPALRRTRSLADGHVAYDRMVRFGEALQQRGVLRASESLGPDAHGARVRVRDGKPVVMDGPFTEAKELVGGFFLLDCKTKAEAVAIARECPAAEWATVEVRALGPCWEQPD